MEPGILFTAIAAIILLAVTSLRFGVDSHEGFPSKERELAGRGLIWGVSPTARDRLLASETDRARQSRTIAGSPSGAGEA